MVDLDLAHSLDSDSPVERNLDLGSQADHNLPSLVELLVKQIQYLVLLLDRDLEVDTQDTVDFVLDKGMEDWLDLSTKIKRKQISSALYHFEIRRKNLKIFNSIFYLQGADILGDFLFYSLEIHTNFVFLLF
jgi:hypothetical protein